MQKTGSRKVSFVYNQDGTLGSVTDATAGVTSFGYDGLTKTYGYDLADELTTVTPSTGSATTYFYDKLGRRTSARVGTDDNLTSIVSTSASVGVDWDRTWDPRPRGEGRGRRVLDLC